jgi:putative membrane protein
MLYVDICDFMDLFVLLFVIVVGCVGGLIAGLFPGVHPNTIAQIFTYVGLDPLALSIAITAAAAVNTIIAVIPAIFLCVPEQSTILSVLPGQRLVNEGRGLHAVWICGVASAITLLVSFALLPLWLVALQPIYEGIKPYMLPILAAICIAFILHEKVMKNIVSSTFIFVISGIFGFLVLNSALLKEPLFAPFIGMFALSNLLLTMNNVRIPFQKQVQRADTVVTTQLIIVIIVGTLLGGLADLLPAIGSSAQLATFGSALTGGSPSMFLAMTTSISLSHLINSFVALHTIGKARIGATAIINEMVGVPDVSILAIYLITIVVAAAFSIALLFAISVPFLRFMRDIDMRVLNALLIVYLCAAVLAVDGLNGIAVLCLATVIGVLPPLMNVRRTHLMAFLIVPTIAYLAL